MLKQYGSVLSRIEKTYGVPGEVLVAIWGLETDFGVNSGKFPTLRSLATLAYDCRRAEEFRSELMDALRIVERGDLAPQEMRGAWAGEIGQTQFMPSSWIKYAVDFDGNGRRDLLHNVPDVLASTANYLTSYGWQRGKDCQPGRPQFRGAAAVEQERGLRQDRRLFRDPARACAIRKSPATTRADRDRDRPPAPDPLTAAGLLGHAGVHRLVQMHAAGTHLAVEHGILSRRDFLLRRQLAVTVGHVLDRRFGLLRFALLQPPPILAAWAGANCDTQRPRSRQPRVTS